MHQQLLNHSLLASLRTALIHSVSVAMIWLFFYHFNAWAFAYFEHNPNVSWVFLPAGIRLLAVFVFGWSGVLGLFVGSIATNENDVDAYVIGLSSISALAPMLAVIICRWSLAIPKSLIGLTGLQLLVFAITGAMTNSFLSQLYFYTPNTSILLPQNFVPMFVGDILGTLIIFFIIAKLIQCLSTRYKPD